MRNDHWFALSRELAELDNPSAPNLRLISRRYSHLLRGVSAGTVLGIADKLLDSTIAGARFVAYDLIARHPAAAQSLSGSQVANLARVLDSWSSVDLFGCYIAGPAWRRGQLSSRAVEHWARSPNRWWRRAALVSTVPLNIRAQGGTGDTVRTLSICRLLRTDRDDMVVKALSWALRALSTQNPTTVAGFLTEYEGVLAPRILREVHSKLTTGRKSNAQRSCS